MSATVTTVTDVNTSPAWDRQPARLDRDDRSTWPEEGQRVLVWILDGWAVQEFGVDESGLLWSDTDDTGEWAEPTTGDLWWPLPPTPGGER